jgi:hypothetical protein
MSVQQIDPTVTPDAANEVVRQLTTPEVPLMQDPPTNVVTLPGGYLDPDGGVYQDARIREITGADEEALARELRSPQISIPRVVDIILRRTVEALGPIQPVPPGVLGNLLTGDRAYLMLAVRILTFGNDWEVPDFPCRFCGELFGTIVELDSIPLKHLDNPMVQEIDVPLRHDHLATVGLMTGAVQLDMMAGDPTIAEQHTIAIDRCIKKIDGRPVVPPLAQKMGMADRHKIVDAMAATQPGPLMEEVGVQCSKCGRDGNYTVSLVDLFR